MSWYRPKGRNKHAVRRKPKVKTRGPRSAKGTQSSSDDSSAVAVAVWQSAPLHATTATVGTICTPHVCATHGTERYR